MGRTSVLTGALCALAFGAYADHMLTLETPVMSPEEGLLLGNGDLSASVYQTADEIVFRFGKGDVWDRRLDQSQDPKPAYIKEFIHGLLVEGWRCNPYDDKGTLATKGTRNEARMKEICQGTPPCTKNRPYPCPKPVGELRMHLPGDLPGPMAIRQQLLIEEGRLVINAAWKNGVTLTVDAVVAPADNVLSLQWEVNGWTEETCVGRDITPVWFGLTRWADPDPVDFAARQKAEWRHGSALARWNGQPVTALPPPTAFQTNGQFCIEQAFYPDNLFTNGFRCRMTLFADNKLGPTYLPELGSLKDAWLTFMPFGKIVAGELAVAVTTSRDTSLAVVLHKPHAVRVTEAAEAAKTYWTKSALSLPDDAFLEDLWYATCHARRCVLRGGTVPPGLFLPSTVRDYSHWHGDYHSNYNLQSIYWGDYTANHLDTAEAYFDCIGWFLPIGRKIARDYYGARGVFIQLEGFPLLGSDDHNGTLPMGRMAYMTGWAMTRYWEHYLYTLDRGWLIKVGYPVIKDCALFYLDFLKKAPSPDLPPDLKDGLYHAFPSVSGESGISGNPLDLTDRPQVIMHIRHALYGAIEASKVLDTDRDLRGQWQDRMDNLAGTRRDLQGIEKHCYLCNPPEAGNGPKPYVPPVEWTGAPRKRSKECFWYFGHSISDRIAALRKNAFIPGRDFPEYRKALETWRHPNGLVWGMALANYGRSGAWTETLSCMAPLQEMMLQSWDGAIRLFPFWPKDKDASFKTFRAQEAFLVSAEWKGGKIGAVTVESEKGAPCLIYGDWRVTAADDKDVATDHDAFGRLRFQTRPGAVYCLYAM